MLGVVKYCNRILGPPKTNFFYDTFFWHIVMMQNLIILSKIWLHLPYAMSIGNYHVENSIYSLSFKKKCMMDNTTGVKKKKNDQHNSGLWFTCTKFLCSRIIFWLPLHALGFKLKFVVFIESRFHQWYPFQKN